MIVIKPNKCITEFHTWKYITTAQNETRVKNLHSWRTLNHEFKCYQNSKPVRTEKDPPKYFIVKPLKATKEKDTLGNSDK